MFLLKKKKKRVSPFKWKTHNSQKCGVHSKTWNFGLVNGEMLQKSLNLSQKRKNIYFLPGIEFGSFKVRVNQGATEVLEVIV